MPEATYFVNYDLTNIVTPVNVHQLALLLRETNYDSDKTAFLIQGFKHGFDLGYRGPQIIKQTAKNLKLDGKKQQIILWNKVMKEVKLKRYAGPFDTIPFDNYIQSPIGLVPKDNGRDVRLIFHLSHPRDPSKGFSVNRCTPKEMCTVQYPDFNKAIQLCSEAGKFCKLSKSDMSSAFRNLGISRKFWKFLVMLAVSPIDGKTSYFIDKCLPFGAVISCAHFQNFSNAVAHVMKVKSGKENVNYLDDFLFIALLRALCNAQIDLFLAICNRINFPVSMEKTFRACTQLTFLGFLIDTLTQTVMIPVEKVIKAKAMLSKVLSKKKITLKELQKVCGFLNFLGRCIVPGRAFTRRLYAYTSSRNSDGKIVQLKPHHHIRVNHEMKSDFEMWHEFVCHQSVYSRGFMDFSKSFNANEISMFSDASRALTLGFGGICQQSWMYGAWPTGYIEKYEPSIEYLELYALVATVLNWIHRHRNKRIILFCDNQSVVHMVNNTTSSCKQCMVLIRKLVLKSLTENVRVFAKYIRSKENVASDLLSRLKIKQFLTLQKWDAMPTPIPPELWPIEQIWLK